MNTLMNKFGDYVLNDLASRVDDEYQLDIALKASAIAYYLMPLTLYAFSAVLAWSLPGWLSLWALVVPFTLLLVEGLSHIWMTARAPRPRSGKMFSTYAVITLGIFIVAMVGVTRKVIELDGLFTASGGIIGALVGGVFTAIFLPRSINRLRKAEAQRIDEELGSD